MKLSSVLFLLLLFVTNAEAQTQPTGPRKDQGLPVRLTPVPPDASPAQIQALLNKHRNVYFSPGSYNIGTLRIKSWRKGLIWGAGRLTTNLYGKIIFEDSREVTAGNFSIHHSGGTSGSAAIAVSGSKRSEITLLSALVTSSKEAQGLQLRAEGDFRIQGCSFTGNAIGIRIDNSRARALVFGGNLQSNRIHIEQVRGHLDARAFGMQMAGGEADIVIQTPSPRGFHLVEGVRSEGSNGKNPAEVLLKVPQTPAAVNVALRANSLGSMARYADYGAAGTLVLLQNVNYLGGDDKSSVGVTVRSKGAARVLSIGNKYGLSYDAAPGPFVISSTTTVQSAGDLWMLPNQDDYARAFNEPITREGMLAAGKRVPPGLSFLSTKDGIGMPIPLFPLYMPAPYPRIRNLAELMLNVRDFGALPNDGKDDREAIQRALDSAEKGAFAPLYFPAGRYELSAPIFLDHLAGGGFWGEGSDRSVLVSTTGKGVIQSDGAGYAAFVDMGFENRPGSASKTTEFDWINNEPANKKRVNTGAALQANVFYRCRFENGGVGMAVGKNRMGDSFLLMDCIFRNQVTKGGDGAAFASEGFNALTNPIVHCQFENVDCAVLNTKGSFQFYGNRLRRIRSAALKFYTIVGDGFALVNNEMDSSAAPFIQTGHSSAKAHLLVEGVKVAPARQKLPGASYALGGSVLFLHSSFPNRTLQNGGGIGDNTLITFKTISAGASASGRAHGYLF